MANTQAYYGMAKKYYHKMFYSTSPRARIFSCVQPFYERAVSDLDRSMRRYLWVYVTHSLFIEGSRATKNTTTGASGSWIWTLKPWIMSCLLNNYPTATVPTLLIKHYIRSLLEHLNVSANFHPFHDLWSFKVFSMSWLLFLEQKCILYWLAIRYSKKCTKIYQWIHQGTNRNLS